MAKAATQQAQGDGTIHTGTVKWFNDAKGFGFINDNESQEDIFVHHTAIQANGFRTLKEGEQVTFTKVKTPKGWQAESVSKA